MRMGSMMYNKALLKRYWIEFIPTSGSQKVYGVTAYTLDDALYILQKKGVLGAFMPDILCSTENIDVSTLDTDHVLPNLTWPTIWRGIWYPSGLQINQPV